MVRVLSSSTAAVVEMKSTNAVVPAHNKQLERTARRHRVRAASVAAPLCAPGAHEALARGRSTARYASVESR